MREVVDFLEPLSYRVNLRNLKNDSQRSISAFRPVLRVASKQQFEDLSRPAQVLICSSELLSGTTFKGRPQARRRSLENLRLLAQALISPGC